MRCSLCTPRSRNTRFSTILEKMRMMPLKWKLPSSLLLDRISIERKHSTTHSYAQFFIPRMKWRGGSRLPICLPLNECKSFHHPECVHLKNFTHSTFDMYYVIWYPHLLRNIFVRFFSHFAFFLLIQANLHVRFMSCIAIKWDEEIRTPDINYNDEKDTK